MLFQPLMSELNISFPFPLHQPINQNEIHCNRTTFIGNGYPAPASIFSKDSYYWLSSNILLSLFFYLQRLKDLLQLRKTTKIPMMQFRLFILIEQQEV